MYLLVFCDGTAKQIRENLEMYDYAAVTAGTLNIYRFDSKDDSVKRLVADEKKWVWVPVVEGKSIVSEGVRIHV